MTRGHTASTGCRVPARPARRCRPRPLPDGPARAAPTSPPAETACRASRELDHAADAVLCLHQLEAMVDVVEREPVREERLDVHVACKPAFDELRDLGPPLDTTERAAGDAPAGDEEARYHLQYVSLAGDAAHGRQSPRLACRLDRLAHDGHVAGRLEGVVRAEPGRFAAYP